MNLNSKKGIEFNLRWLIYSMVLIALLAGSFQVMRSFNTGNAFAESSAETLGRAIDVATLSNNNLTISLKCPGGYFFTIKHGVIKAEASGLLYNHKGFYSIIYDTGTNLDIQKEIDCSSYSNITVEKKINPETSERTLEVNGVE